MNDGLIFLPRMLFPWLLEATISSLPMIAESAITAMVNTSFSLLSLTD